MPIYSYQCINKIDSCDYCQEGFDVLQKMADDKLSHCPKCENEIKKIITAANLAVGITSDSKSTLSQKNIEKNGFAQYRKVAKGMYEKSAGKGPQFINGD